MAERNSLHALNAALSEANLPPDEQLLDRFAMANDHGAFELLLRRHADMVWRVCIGTLPRDRQAAEDAFQATFLVLARRAGRVDANLPGWLFRVARRTAIRANQVRIQTITSAELDHRESNTTCDSPSELPSAVLEEIERLATKFRDPVLLCFYGGHTHAEAAAKLGWPIGTLASRLARAKDKLRERLARRGVALAAAGLAGALSSPVAALGPDVVRSSLGSVLGPPTALSASVATLSHGVLMAMRIAKWKLIGLAASAFLVIASVGVAVGIGQDKPNDKTGAPKVEAATADLARTAVPEIQPDAADPLPSSRPVPGANDSELRRLQLARFQLALAEYEAGWAVARAGAASKHPNWDTVETLVAAAADVYPTAEAAKWFAWKVAVAKQREVSVLALVETRAAPKSEAQTATRVRVEAEIELLKFRQVRVPARESKVVELAKLEVDRLEQTLALNQKFLDGGAFDVNTLSNTIAVHRELLGAARIAFGESREALAKIEAVRTSAREVQAMIQKRFDSGTVRRQELTHCEAHVHHVDREWESLNSYLKSSR